MAKQQQRIVKSFQEIAERLKKDGVVQWLRGDDAGKDFYHPVEQRAAPPLHRYPRRKH